MLTEIANHRSHDHSQDTARDDLLARLPELLAFRAPYLEEKLVKEKMVGSREEAALLFEEVKRYLVLGRVHPSRPIPMFSRRVDEAWHQFVLFTVEYLRFGERFFGELVPHEPNGAPASSTASRMTFDEFRVEYRALFGQEVPDAWRDERALTASTRVIRADFGRPISVRVKDDKAELVWHLEPERILLRAGEFAEKALRFIVDHSVFYLRELPGLDDSERVALCAPLVQTNVLRVAP